MKFLDYLPRFTIPARNREPLAPGLKVERGAIENVVAGFNDQGSGQNWAQTAYGNYFFTNTWVNRAVKLRSDSVASAKLRIMQESTDGLTPVDPTHPIQEVMDRVNNLWTAKDLWKYTEMALGLWGSAFWWVDKESPNGNVEIWPLRPDRMKIVSAKDSILRSNVKVGDRKLKSGTWLLGVEVFDKGVRQAILSGQLKGFSIGGRGESEPASV